MHPNSAECLKIASLLKKMRTQKIQQQRLQLQFILYFLYLLSLSIYHFTNQNVDEPLSFTFIHFMMMQQQQKNLQLEDS